MHCIIRRPLAKELPLKWLNNYYLFYNNYNSTLKLEQYYTPWIFAGIICCGLLLLLQLLMIEHSPWTGDYWEHKAVVRELSVRLQHPKHPILNVDVPHAFFSPYMVFLGATVTATGIAVNTALNIAMVVNLGLFLLAIYLLVTLFTNKYDDRAKAFVLLLLLILFFWGPQAPLYSSFFHLRSLVLTLSYPSTFAFSCSVFAASAAKYILTTIPRTAKQVVSFITLILLLSIILLCHPLTFVFAALLILYVYNSALTHNKFTKQQLINKTLVMFSAGIISLALAGLWPYYPVFALFKYIEGGNQFHADSFLLYQSLSKQLFPLLLLPVLVFFSPSISLKKEGPWLISVSILFLLFAIGYYTRSYGMGRIIAFVFIFCHMLIVKNLMSIKQKKIGWFALLFLLAIPYLLQTKTTFKQLFSSEAQIISDADQFQNASHPAKARLLSFLEPVLQYESSVVLTDMPTSLFVPAMGARVVAAVYPVYWVSDAGERKKQVQLFFFVNTNETDRANLIARYKPDYILLTPATASLLPQLSSFIQPQAVVSSNGISLYRIKTTQKP